MMQRSNPAGRGFVEGLLQRAGNRRQVEQWLRQWGGERVYLPRRSVPQGPTPADVARELVFASVGRGAAAAIVRARCGISDRHARRLVRAAVAVRGQTMSASSRTIGSVITKG